MRQPAQRGAQRLRQRGDRIFPGELLDRMQFDAHAPRFAHAPDVGEARRQATEAEAHALQAQRLLVVRHARQG